MSRIRITIDKLALAGFEPGTARAVTQALERELARAFADPAARTAWARSRQMPVLRLGRLPLDAGAAGGRQLGEGVAQAIKKGVTP